MAAHILKKHGSYNPAKLFGVCELDHLRARHYLADLICMDPKWTYVPVVGGHGENTTVPLFSRCRPNIELTPEEMMNLTKAVRTAGKNIVKVISFPWFITYFLGFYKRKRGEKETKQKEKGKKTEEYAYEDKKNLSKE